MLTSFCTSTHVARAWEQGWGEALMWRIITPPPGAPSPPTNLTLSLLPQGLGVNLSWTPGSALEGEVVTFVITSFDLALGTSNETRVNSSLVSLNLPPPDGRSCQQFRFTVQAENDFSRSIFNVSEDAVIPTGMQTTYLSLKDDLYLYIIISSFCSGGGRGHDLCFIVGRSAC